MDAPGIGGFCPNRECDVVDALLGRYTFTVAPDPRDVATRATVEAEIVAWLLRINDTSTGWLSPSDLADMIEAGAHRPVLDRHT
jgi:hypothetical protein